MARGSDDINPIVAGVGYLVVAGIVTGIWAAVGIIFGTIGAAVLQDFGWKVMSMHEIVLVSAVGGAIIGSPSSLLWGAGEAAGAIAALTLLFGPVIFGVVGAAALHYTGTSLGYAAAAMATADLTLAVAAVGLLVAIMILGGLAELCGGSRGGDKPVEDLKIEPIVPVIEFKFDDALTGKREMTMDSNGNMQMTLADSAVDSLVEGQTNNQRLVA